MNTIFLILISTFIVSIIAFVGIITLILKEKLLQKILLILVSFSAGGLIGNSFLHLLPEAAKSGNENIFPYFLTGFVLFFLIERIFHWRHCHKEKCPVHAFAYLNLLGDSVHNFIDGLIIGASFIINTNLGITTTLAVILHEVPQEIGEFGVLVYGGFKKMKALFLNFLTALTAILGGIVGYYLSNYIHYSTTFLLPFAAGGFTYIAASDLIPEIRKEKELNKSLISFVVFILGILIMFAMKLVNH